MLMSEVYKLFQKGQEAIKLKQAAEEATKSGVLRGGSAGLLFENGDHTGNCLSKTYLRYSGVDTSSLEEENIPNGGRELMFSAGRFNEDAWMTVLSASGYKGKILREEDIPISWKTRRTKTKVTGRPDIVLCKSDGTPVTGLELKLICSIWTARTVLINRTPKMSHLIQAAHYMWKLGVPFELWYTSRTDFEASSDFNLRMYPAYGEPGSELFTYRFSRIVADPLNGDFKRSAIDETKYLLLREAGEEVEAKVGKYKPFIQGFKLFFDTKGRLWYVDAVRPEAEAQLTIVTQDRIANYYEKVAELVAVPEEPVTLKPDGKKENYKLSSYCSLGKFCCKMRQGDDIKEWVEDVKVLVAGGTPTVRELLAKPKRPRTGRAKV
jgi:hypothetical protein